MRSMLSAPKDLLLMMNELEAKVGNHDKNISQIFEILKTLVDGEKRPQVDIGFKQKLKNKLLF